jgi:hypothetical protein
MSWRLSRTEAVGRWARALFANGWPQALATLRAAPEASTFARAVQQVQAGAAASR